MPLLKKAELLNRIISSIRDSGWQLILASKLSHPLDCFIFKDDEKYLVRFYIWNLTHGGKSRAEDEFRIQITGVDSFQPVLEGKTLILGWWEDVGVYAGFDLGKHSGVLGASPSLQIKTSALKDAYEFGLATQEKGNKELVVAFRPDMLIEYIRQLEQINLLGGEAKNLKALSDMVRLQEMPSSQEILSIPKPRRTVIVNLKKRLRDSGFKDRVLTAYSRRCAICGTQLELVDAAHILPVVHGESTDETSNGLALCALHHRAYDKGFLIVEESYHVKANNRYIENLKLKHLDEGLGNFMHDLRPIILLPPSRSDRPKPEYLKLGVKIRALA